MNPIPTNPNPTPALPLHKLREIVDDPGIQEPPEVPAPSIPYGYEDTKDWSWR